MELPDNCFETIERVCDKTFGPNGVSALVQGPTGSMSVTRRGWVIVQSIYEESNLKSSAMKVFLDNMKEINKTFGDGVKSFALIEITFLKKLMHMKIANRMSVATIFQELQSLLRAVCNMDILSSITLSLRKREDRMKATGALFSTSCPSAVSSNLQTKFHDWISSSLCIRSCRDSDENIVSRLQFLFKNFDLLCHRNNSSSRCVSDSYILPGYLVDRVPLNLNRVKEEQVQLELYIPETEVDNLYNLFRIKLIIKAKSSERCVRTLLLTTAFLTEEILFELKQHNFVVLHGVPTEDAKFISSILQQNTDVLNNVTIKICFIGNKEYACFLLPNIFQLILCAPTDSLICEYAGICRNALKHLLVTARSLYATGLVEAGGIFEKTLHFHIAKQIKKVGDSSLFLVNNRKELLQWHRQNQLMKSSLSVKKEHCVDIAVRNASLTGELNNFEQNESEENNSISNLKSIEFACLHEGRKSQVLKHLTKHENHWKSNLEVNGLLLHDVGDNILAAFAQSILRICNPVMSGPPETEIYEPISFKIQLLHHVIVTAILFFKCDIAK